MVRTGRFLRKMSEVRELADSIIDSKKNKGFFTEDEVVEELDHKMFMSPIYLGEDDERMLVDDLCWKRVRREIHQFCDGFKSTYR